MNLRKISNEQLEHSAIKKEEQEPALNGTFAAVMLLGTFLAASWLAVFILFLSRQ
ncbi:cytochrome c oxidase subunit 2A [Paenibacillus sp. GCM10027628]|uniref:cytochrome c oxidase subunit 2A n=1 Tax=Paenibacillus sp. GCM10027628 TaxID=3273413 RepID=UPI00363F2DBE